MLLPKRKDQDFDEHANSFRSHQSRLAVPKRKHHRIRRGNPSGSKIFSIELEHLRRTSYLEEFVIQGCEHSLPTLASKLGRLEKDLSLTCKEKDRCWTKFGSFPMKMALRRSFSRARPPGLANIPRTISTTPRSFNISALDGNTWFWKPIFQLSDII